jgi:pyruvate dehydrogenase E2 component (dihydrolipoamide acetyltransferase)
MAHEVIMPQLGLSMDNGRIIRWLKGSGQRVQTGEVLLEVESDKAILEVEAIHSGILQTLKGPEDSLIPVGATIAYLLEDGEVLPPKSRELRSTIPASSSSSERLSYTASESSIKETPILRDHDHPRSSPAARRRAKELGLDWQLATGTGPDGRIKESDILQLAARKEIVSVPSEVISPIPKMKINISPIARNIAEAVGLDLEEFAMQHPGKRLEREDVYQAIKETLDQARKLSKKGQLVAGPISHRVPINDLRRIIAERMANSAHSTAPVTLMTEADATEIVKILENLKTDASHFRIPSYNAILAKLVSIALSEHPDLNSRMEGDTLVYWETVNIGIAVDTTRGLVVPVIHDAQTKSLFDLSEEMEKLLARASTGKAMPDELKGSTFTITNLGMYEITSFTPIINTPECAVLGVGRLAQKMVITKGEPAIRTMLPLNLTFDHRIVDGAPAARFLQKVKHLIEQPYLWWQLR